MTYHLAREGNELPRKKRIVPTTQELIDSFEKEVVQRSTNRSAPVRAKAVEWNKDQGPFYIDVIKWEALDPESAGEEPPSLVEIPEDICAIYAERVDDEIIYAFLREKYEGWEATEIQWEDDSWPEASL